MARAKKKTARLLALRTIRRVEKDQAYLDRLIDYYQDQVRLKPEERKLFSELAYGVVRNQRLIDYYLEQVMDRKIHQTDLTTRALLRLGAYQLLFLDKIPPPAAINETVKLSAQYARPYINAVLRKLLEKKNKLHSPDAEPDVVRRLSVKYSHPEWLVRRWLVQFGEEETERLLSANNERPPITLRVNSIRTSQSALIEYLARYNIKAKAGKFSPYAVIIEEHKFPRRLPGYEQGLFAIQDEASQVVVLLLEPKPGDKILDACSAPGTKTLEIYQLMERKGRLVSADIHQKRLELVKKEAKRLGLSGFELLVQDLTQPLNLSGKKKPVFDKILIDAPCTGLGTIRRHPEIKWQRKPEDVQKLSELQKALIKNLAQYVKLEGILVYSTCTWTVEENQAVISLLIEKGEFELEDPKPYLPSSARALIKNKIMQTFPHKHGTDGFCAFRLRRIK